MFQIKFLNFYRFGILTNILPFQNALFYIKNKPKINTFLVDRIKCILNILFYNKIKIQDLLIC